MSFETIFWLIGLVSLGGSLTAYFRTRDTLHPLIFIGPMMFYTYALVPAAVYYREELLDLFPDAEALREALLFTLACVTLFTAGALRRQPTWTTPPTMHPTSAARRLRLLAYALGAIGLSVFLYRLSLAGGLLQAYSRPKGGAAPLPSGYLTVAPLLTIPAALLLFMSRRDQPLRLLDLAQIVILLSPHWIQGLLGGSRGPMFLALGSFFFGWFILRARRPPLRLVIVVLTFSGLLIMFLKAHRMQLYLGAEEPLEREDWTEIIVPRKGIKDHASMYSLGGIVAVRHHRHYLWGKGFAVQLFVRAIPRQLWPNKYEAVGMEWMVTRPGSLGLSPSQWREAVGWEPNAGTATGFVLSVFAEFGWAGALIAYALGWFYSFLWRRFVARDGIWSLWYAEAALISVYLTTQGLISAWGYRLLYLGIPTWVLWLWITRSSASRVQVPAPAASPA